METNGDLRADRIHTHTHTHHQSCYIIVTPHFLTQNYDYSVWWQLGPLVIHLIVSSEWTYRDCSMNSVQWVFPHWLSHWLRIPLSHRTLVWITYSCFQKLKPHSFASSVFLANKFTAQGLLHAMDVIQSLGDVLRINGIMYKYMVWLFIIII